MNGLKIVSNDTIFNVQKNVNPHFKPVWTTKKPYNVLMGGRSSFKSSVVVLLLANMMMKFISQDDQANIVVIRKVANTLRDSVYLKIKWALSAYGILDEFDCTLSPIKIRHRETGSTFYFYGMDDPQKLKSNDIGDLIGLWIEEAAEFESKEDFDQTLATFTRQCHKKADMVKVFWSYNPPRNPYSWINEWSESLMNEKDYLVHKSSYLDDKLGFVNKQMLSDIDRIKRNDYDYYRYLYLGEPVGLGTNIYNLSQFKALDELPDDDRLVSLYYSVDGGHSRSATTVSCFGMTKRRRIIMLDVYYYSPDGKANKKAPSDLSIAMNEFITKTSKYYNVPIRRRTIDSAEGALYNQYYKDFGIYFNKVAKKKKDVMVDYTHVLLAEGRFYYLRKPADIGMTNAGATDIFIDECKKYMWDEKTIDSDNPKVVKSDDHIIDGFQYACVDNAKEWGIKR